ncbi:MAG: hypothetical protein K2F57_01915 [Candidatus Gastranaerophilales bacterium]|nr:hypothetical protein [Candidatus Gastranaerophilales bacterium]
MEISFTGIQNLYIGKKTYSKFGSYVTNSGMVKRGNKEYTDVLIKCDLTDDAQGKHLSEFYETLAKCRPCYQVNCINREKPNHFKLLMKHFGVEDGDVNVLNSSFKINDYDIMLDERQILPLFSFMAKITRQIAHAKGPSDAQKEYAKFVNHGIHNEAMNYIENIM